MTEPTVARFLLSLVLRFCRDDGLVSKIRHWNKSPWNWGRLPIHGTRALAARITRLLGKLRLVVSGNPQRHARQAVLHPLVRQHHDPYWIKPITMSKIVADALKHGLHSIEDIEGRLIPFTLVLDDTPDPKHRTMKLARYPLETVEDSLRAARNNIFPGKEKSMYAIAFDGFVTRDGRKWDAILVEAGSADEPEGVLMAQRYEAKIVDQIFSRNTAVGDPIHIDSVPSRLWKADNAA